MRHRLISAGLPPEPEQSFPTGAGGIMRSGIRGFLSAFFYFAVFVFVAAAQVGNSGSIEGVVKDSSGGAIANATVQISNPVSGFHRQAATGSDGTFRFTN